LASFEGNYRKGLFNCQETKSSESLTGIGKNGIMKKQENKKFNKDLL
jgi:hypothetical protein